MRKITIFIISILIGLGIANTTLGLGIAINPTQNSDAMELLARIGNWIFTVALAVAPLMILFGAYMLVTAAGNPEKISSGKRIIIFSLLGFAIIVMAKGIIAVVIELLK